MKIQFEVWGIPKGQGRPRHRRIGKDEKMFTQTYDPPISADWKDLVRWQVQQHRPPEPSAKAIRLTLIFLMPIPKGTAKYKVKAVTNGEEILHTKVPDMDQLEKPIMDMLQQAGYYVNDSQVADRGGSKKIYAMRPGVLVTLEEIDQRVTI